MGYEESQGKRALKKATRKAKRKNRRRALDRDAEQIFYDQTQEKRGTKAILEGLANYGKTAREKAKNQ